MLHYFADPAKEKAYVRFVLCEIGFDALIVLRIGEAKHPANPFDICQAAQCEMRPQGIENLIGCRHIADLVPTACVAAIPGVEITEGNQPQHS